MINLPEGYAITLLTFGMAMVLVCLVGKISIKDVEFGSDKRWARATLGFLGAILITISIMPFILSENTPNISSSDQININIPEAKDNVGIGWIRAGAIQKDDNDIDIEGKTLIETNHPVSISPLTVPEKGDFVTVISYINLRQGPPESPDYDPTKKLSLISPNTKLEVIDLKAFIDPNTGSSIVVWIEVKLAQ